MELYISKGHKNSARQIRSDAVLLSIKTAHSYKLVANTKATLDKNGSATTKACTVCGKTKKLPKTYSVYKVSSVKLSEKKLNYTGKAQKPTVSVKNSKGTKLKNGVDYTVKYSNLKSKAIGSYTVKVTLNGNYKGSKTLKYKIVVPATKDVTVKNVTKQMTFKKTTKGYDDYNLNNLTTETRTVGKGVKVGWKKVSGVTGYQVQYSLRSDFSTKKKYNYARVEEANIGKITTPVAATYTKTIKGSDTTSTTINGTIAAKYYIRVRTYITKGDKTYYSAWSSVQKIKAKYNCADVQNGKLVYAGNKYHVCLNAKDHFQIAMWDGKLCTTCGSLHCESNYTYYTQCKCFGAICPKTNVEDLDKCEVCHKEKGIGKGKCITLNTSGDCSICGKYVKAWACHECLGEVK